MNTEGRVTVERRGHVFLMGLDRVAKRNAFDQALVDGLIRAYTELERDDVLRCGVLFAHGEHFTAGLDLAELAPILAEGRNPFAPADDAIDPFGVYGGAPRSKPVVAAVHGICLTLGIELLLAADVRVAASNARFAQMEVQRGIYPFGGATIRFVREAGWGNAMRYLLTGDEFGAVGALRMGLVQEVVETGQELNRATALAERIAEQAPLGVRATVASASRAIREGEDAAACRLHADVVPLIRSEDAREGLQSFVERRRARV